MAKKTVERIKFGVSHDAMENMSDQSATIGLIELLLLPALTAPLAARNSSTLHNLLVRVVRVVRCARYYVVPVLGPYCYYYSVLLVLLASTSTSTSTGKSTC